MPVTDDVRAAWARTRLDQLGRDVRYGLRQLRRNPAFSAIAIATLALAIGVALAAVAARLMTALFYGFQPDYAPAIAMVSLMLLAVAALACLVPARRASRIDPMVALQHE